MARVGNLRTVVGLRPARALAAAALAALALGSASPVGGDDPWRESGEWWRSPIHGTEHRFLVHDDSGEKVLVAPDGRRFDSIEAAARAEAATLSRSEIVLGASLRAAAEDPERRDRPEVVTFLLGPQPLHTAGEAARRRHAPRFAALLREQRAILGGVADRRTPDPARRLQVGERAREERDLLSEADRERVRALRDEVLALRRALRREVIEEAKPAAARAHAPVVAWLESRGGRVLSRNFGLCSVTARITPRAAVDAVEALPSVHRIEIAGVSEVGLDISVPSIGASSWAGGGYDGSSTTKVCVIDTGIDSGHPALDNGIVSDAAVYLTAASGAGNFNDDASSTDDLQFHGTHVGGIVMSNDDTGNLDGVAPGGRLMNGKAGYRTTSGGGSLFDPDIFDAGDWASDNGADVFNCSFGGGATTNGNSSLALFFDAMVHDLNIGAAISAGNSGSGSGTILTPADGFNVVTVGNYDDNGTTTDADDFIAGSSSRGPCSDGRRKPDLSAPGSNIASCHNQWESSADFVSATGTSMSAPHVAGALCLLEDYAASWAPESMKALLITNVRNSGQYPSTPDNNFGYGGINLSTAFTNRTCVIEGTLSSGTIAFLRAPAMAANERVTLCWNRQVISNDNSAPTTIYSLVDLDLSVYDESDGSSEGSSASGVNSVEQVKVASTLTSPVIKVKRGSFPSGVTAQDFSVAAEDAGTLASVAAPSLTAIYTAAPTLLAGNRDFTVTVRVDNGGGLPAFAPSVTLTIPSGYSIQSGANPQTLAAIGGSASGTASWTVRSASSGTSGSRTLQAAASSSSYGETWATGTVSSNHDLDLEAPTGTVTIAAGADFVNSTSVDLVVAASDDLSGPAQMQFSNDGTTFSAWEDLAPTKSWVMAAGSDGTRTVRVRFRDTAENESGSFTDDTTLDTAAPSGTVVAAGDATWTNTRAITLTLSATDALSGMSMMRFGSDGTTWRPWAAYATSAAFLLPAGDGSKTVYAEFQDVAGNVSTAVTDGIGLDTTLPSGTVSVAGDATYTTTGNVALGLSASDALSGVTEMRFSNDGTTWGAWTPYATSTAWTLSAGDGAKTVLAEFRDAALNISSPAASDGITRDGTPPSGTLSIDGGSTATSSTGVTLAITSSDPVSGATLMRLRNGTGAFGSWIAIQPSLPWTLPSGDSSKTVGIQFSDGAGNVSSETTDSILLDQTAPIGSVAILNGKAAINGTAVTVDVGYSDNLSGVALVRLSNDGGASWGAWTGPASPLGWDLAPGEGTRTVHYQMRDVAGNVSVPISDTIQLDTTLPTGSFVLNGDRRYLLGAFPLVADTTSDDGAAGSGVVELRVSHDAGDTWSDWLPIGVGDVEIPRPAGRGLRTVRGEFRDLAGNSSPAFDETIHLVEDAPQSLASVKKLLGALPQGGDVDSFLVDLVAGDALTLKGKAKAAQKGIKVTLGFDLHSPSGATIFTGRYPADLKAPGVSRFVATETGPHTVVLRTEGTDMDAAATYALTVKVAAAKTNLSFAGTAATGIAPFTAARGGTVSAKLTGNVVPPVVVAPPSGVPEIVDIVTKGSVHSLVPAALDGPTGGWEIRFSSAGSVTYTIKVKPAKRLVVPEDPDAALP